MQNTNVHRRLTDCDAVMFNCHMQIKLLVANCLRGGGVGGVVEVGGTCVTAFRDILALTEGRKCFI